MATRRLSILAVTSELPWPLDSGGHLRTYHLLRRLAADHDVRLVAPAAEVTSGATRALAEAGVTCRVARTRPRGRARQAADAIVAGATGVPYVMYRRHYRRAVEETIASESRTAAPDVVYLDHLDSFVYAIPGDPTVVGDLHNVYSKLLERTATDQHNPLLRAYLGREAGLLAAAERDAAQRAHLLMTVSETERAHFATLGTARAVSIPNGVDCAHHARFPAGRPDAAPIVMFLGAMSWEPNAAAAEFLAARVLPTLQQKIPGARVRIVGRNPPARVQRLASNPAVEVTGAVADVAPFLREAAVLAVPLTAGGGTRLKILEAFAAGLPVVSTDVGAEGIEATPGRHLTIADPAGFADAVARVLADRETAASMARNARALVEQQYDWSALGARASDTIGTLHAERRRG